MILKKENPLEEYQRVFCGVGYKDVEPFRGRYGAFLKLFRFINV